MAYTIERVFPSESDVGGTDRGRVFQETTWDMLLGPNGTGLSKSIGANFVKDGFDYSSASGLDATFNGGKAIIDGRYVECTSTEDVTLTASTTNFVWLQLTPTSGNVTSAQLFDSTAVAVQPRAVLLSVIVTGVSTVSSQVDCRPNTAWGRIGTYSGNGSGTQTFYVGFRPRTLQINATAQASGLVSGGIARTIGGTDGTLSLNDLGFVVGGTSGGLNNSGVTYGFSAFHGELAT